MQGENAVLSALRWSMRALAGLLLLVIAAWTVSRWMPVPEAQRQALALLEPQVPFDGRNNAFAALWLLGYGDIAEGEREAVLAEDVRRMRALAQLPIDAEVPAGLARSSASGRYPERVASGGPCRWRQPGCLAEVRAGQAAVEAAVRERQALLVEIAALSAFDHYQMPYPADFRQPLPALQLLQQSLAAHALAHVQGRSAQALAGICADTRTARMLMSHSDGLVPVMTGAAMIEGNVRLLADVLAELPAGTTVPAACAQVFTVPTAQALSLCPAMRGEFRVVSHGSLATGPWWRTLVWDPDKTRALLAEPMAGACAAEAEQALVEDRPVTWTVAPRSRWRLQCAANGLGCLVADIARPDHAGFAVRLQDAGAQLRLAEALLWLHDHAGSDDPLARLPARLRDGRRPLQLSADGNGLQVASYQRRDGTVLPPMQLPLPGSAVPP